MPRGALLVLFGATAPVAFGQCEPVWSGLNGGAGWEVRALATFDEDGPGPLAPALFIGGGFYRIAGIESNLLTRWDGWRASKVGSGLEADSFGIDAIGIIPQQVGMLLPGLYAAGEIDTAGGVPVNNIARWWAPDWHDVGGGLTSDQLVIVFGTQVFDEDGAGPIPPALFVGGQFKSAGAPPGIPAEGLARWDGARWSAVGGGLATSLPGTFAKVWTMAVYDDGRGPALYVGGSFTYADGKLANNIARWDGSAWEPVGGGLSSTVESLCVFDEDGPGPKRPALFVGGQFNWAGGGVVRTKRIARWDGSAWSDVGGWLSDGVIRAMLVWDGGSAGPASLYVGGKCNALPDLTPVNHVARWDGAKWHKVGEGVTGFGAGTGVSGMAVFDEDGPGPNPGGLYVGGLFYYAGGVETHHIARWGCPLGPRPCAADCDGDGELTFFDFLCFQNQFAFADMRADCDRSGALDLFDFLCFQDSFAMGCP
ncbi:MAG: hypothetical protein ACF8R7_11855 [Phycisphaerales bacterium JB039]